MDDAVKSLFNKDFLDKWNINYDKIKEFSLQRRGIADELDGDLMQWITLQKQTNHLLPRELRDKLSALNLKFDQEASDSSWDTSYNQLADFVREYGQARPSADQKHEVLRDWLNRQILNKRLLTEKQFHKLDSLGVDWDTPLSRDHGWQLMFLRLVSFHKMFRHCRVPAKWEKDKQLALWVIVQRRMYSHEKIRADRQQQLNELGFVWKIEAQYEEQWDSFFTQLSLFKQQHGHCRVPGSEGKLVSWIERQRLSRKKKLLPARRERMLDEISFDWSFDNFKKERWNDKYKQLCSYKEANGHSFVPVNFRANKSLGTWVASQRLLEARGKLSAAKKKKLNDLDFVWSRDTQRQLQAEFETLWNNKFEKLKKYRQTHGTCQVSLKSDIELQRWTCWQRKFFYQGRLSAERIDRLNEICFPWSIKEGYWMRMFDILVDFKKQFGHTVVPSQWKQNPQLSAWVYRLKLNKANLGTQKIELLNGIGFQWTLHRKTLVPWEVQYNRLVAFKQKHGHTRVPVRWSEDPSLGKWVSRMRYIRENIDPERILLLEAIAFEWRREPASKVSKKRPHQSYILT